MVENQINTVHLETHEEKPVPENGQKGEPTETEEKKVPMIVIKWNEEKRHVETAFEHLDERNAVYMLKKAGQFIDAFFLNQKVKAIQNQQKLIKPKGVIAGLKSKLGQKILRK